MTRRSNTMNDRSARPELGRARRILGSEALSRLDKSHVAVFGLGGVGGSCAEALARAGVGHLTLVDRDEVDISNINRQAFAVHSTVGLLKVDAARARLRNIAPEIELTTIPMFYLPENAGKLNLSGFDYVVDAIDTVTAKIELIRRCHEAGVPIISCMGAGNRLDPSKLCIRDLFETTGDPLARVMRRELRKVGVDKLTVVCSTETPLPIRPEEMPEGTADAEGRRKAIPGSTAFVPPAAGLLAASFVARKLMETEA